MHYVGAACNQTPRQMLKNWTVAETLARYYFHSQNPQTRELKAAEVGYYEHKEKLKAEAEYLANQKNYVSIAELRRMHLENKKKKEENNE